MTAMDRRLVIAVVVFGLAIVALGAGLAAAATAAPAKQPATLRSFDLGKRANTGAVRHALRIGLRHWHKAPCYWRGEDATVRVEVRRTRKYEAFASVALCRIKLSPAALASPFPRLCHLIVHELGHLTGHAHARRKHRLMSPHLWRPYWSGCRSNHGGSR